MTSKERLQNILLGTERIDLNKLKANRMLKKWGRKENSFALLFERIETGYNWGYFGRNEIKQVTFAEFKTIEEAYKILGIEHIIMIIE